MMSPTQLAIVWASLLAVMLVCRCAPMMLLGGRSLSARAERAISLIPVAAFAALVANDLVSPEAWAADPAGTLVQLASATVVCLVARRTGSLIWCALVGMATFALLGALVG